MIVKPSKNMDKTGDNTQSGVADKLLAIVEELTNLMEVEVPMVGSNDTLRHAELVKRKQELTMDYQAILKMLGENQEHVKGMSAEDQASLRASGKKLDEATRRNAEAIRMAHLASERLLHVIMDEIRRDLHRESGYSMRGVMALAESSKSRPVAYNQRV